MNQKKNVALAALLIAIKASAQVGIGTETPDASAILDIVSTNKGVLIPRVTLPSVGADLDGLDGQPNGLFIYNANGPLAEGFYFWNGSEWEVIESSTAVAPRIQTLECDHALLEPATFRAGTPYIGILRIPYSGGNGGKYPGATAGIPSTNPANPTLQATLRAGALEQGRGYLIYDVTGTPQKSSPEGATFPLTFAGLSGEAKVGYTENAVVTSTYSTGPLIPLPNNQGYQREVSSFDGKFSVRIYFANNASYNTGQLQIRCNVKDKVGIMWSGLTSRIALTGTASNLLLLPDAQVWTSGSWGPADIGSSEQRSYVWTTTDVTEKTVYHLTLMAFLLGNAPPKGNISLKIEQIQAD
ncbi:MAG: hypothetical protein LBS05_10305 [Tannerellaceae bacterium]|jgi:hypothetical protein|nr:hypothetical protein [Tannerellaceae bacterium]